MKKNFQSSFFLLEKNQQHTEQMHLKEYMQLFEKIKSNLFFIECSFERDEISNQAQGVDDNQKKENRLMPFLYHCIRSGLCRNYQVSPEVLRPHYATSSWDY